MMTLHVLHAADGYTSLTRPVASGDHQPLGGGALSDYCASDGNPPGRRVGTGREESPSRTRRRQRGWVVGSR